ncbi:MAG TPA: hypothetical protein VGG01_07705 [Xanthobacteraceae bacterium]|jgi:uncharacterized membrane protein YjjB (DUF3815 family)
MSEWSNHPPYRPPPDGPGCLTAVMILGGIILLLPGVCAALIIGFDPRRALGDRTTLSTCLVFFAIAAGGVALIWAAVRRPR